MESEKIVEDVPVTVSISMTKDDVTMIWQALNAPGVGIPFANAAQAASLHDKIKAAALAHGVLKA